MNNSFDKFISLSNTNFKKIKLWASFGKDALPHLHSFRCLLIHPNTLSKCFTIHPNTLGKCFTIVESTG